MKHSGGGADFVETMQTLRPWANAEAQHGGERRPCRHHFAGLDWSAPATTTVPMTDDAPPLYLPDEQKGMVYVLVPGTVAAEAVSLLHWTTPSTEGELAQCAGSERATGLWNVLWASPLHPLQLRTTVGERHLVTTGDSVAHS